MLLNIERSFVDLQNFAFFKDNTELIKSFNLYRKQFQKVDK